MTARRRPAFGPPRHRLQRFALVKGCVPPQGGSNPWALWLETAAHSRVKFREIRPPGVYGPYERKNAAPEGGEEVAMKTEMTIKKLPVSMLKPAKYNPRKDLKPGDPAYEKIKRSLHDFGYVDPVIWNEVTGNIVGGHQRYRGDVKPGMWVRFRGEKWIISTLGEYSFQRTYLGLKASMQKGISG